MKFTPTKAFKPHDYQSFAIDRMVEQENLGLFLDMGLGKTIITLSAIVELRYHRWAVRKVLVIAPKTVAMATWQKEAARWEHTQCLRFATVLGTAKQREKALEQTADVYVINRENVQWLVDYYRQQWPFDMVVIDESSSFKNPQSKRFKKLRTQLCRVSRLVELTGTPSPQSLEDLWSQVYLLDSGKRLGRTLTSFREQYFTQDYAFPGQTYRTYTPMPDAAERIQKAIADICISMKAEDYLSLPDYVENVVPVVLDPAARKQYEKLEREMLLSVDESEITASSAAVLRGKLLQLCDGAVYDSEGEAVVVHECKVEAFMELIEQLHGEHALVFYRFQHDRDRLLAELEKTGLRVRVYHDDSDEEAWNSGEVDVLLAHPASCGYGLNLQRGGHHIVWFGLTDSLEQYQQSNARLYRQGQEHPVIVHHLVVQGGVDEDVIKALHGKSAVQDELLTALKARIAGAKSHS